MKTLSLLFLSILFLVRCASQDETIPVHLNIQEIHPNKFTAMTKQNLLHLTQVYELSPFFFTHNINIKSQPLSHSHPVLTLNTQNAENPNKILATFLHEELHWWLDRNPENRNLALADLKKVYPKIPATGSLQTTHLHLIVCYLELKALAFYLGEKEARGLISNIMRKDKIYPWVYHQVLYRDKFIKEAVTKHKLLPPVLF